MINLFTSAHGRQSMRVPAGPQYTHIVLQLIILTITITINMRVNIHIYIYIYIHMYIQLRPFSLGQKSDARSQDPDHCVNNSAGPEQRRDRVRPAHDVRDSDGIKRLGEKPGRN